MIFDTHAHYDSRQFDEDRAKILELIHTTGICINGNSVPVGKLVNVGADMESSHTTLALADTYDFIYAAVGVHPDSAGELIWSSEKCPKSETEISEESCNRNREILRELAKKEKVVAIGEIGLDYHWDIWPRDIQKEAFRWQWKLAEELKLPVIIHSRDAAEDTLNIVRSLYNRNDYKVSAVMHCYSYSPEHAEEYLKIGLMFGIGGVVTFKNARKLKEVVDMLPMDRILLETDCPYMAPDPFRGKRNNSGYLTYVAEKIAEIKGLDVKTVYDMTWENAERFFGLDE